jgi:hypothetical protein
MRKKLKILAVISLVVFFLPEQFIFAQNNYKIVIISPRVGEVIDKTEKDYFHLFQTIKEFEQGIFFEDSSGAYYGVIKYTNQNGISCDTVINYSEAYLLRTSELIDNLEKILAGGYQFTRTDYQFTVVGDTTDLLTNVTLTSINNSGNYLNQKKRNVSYKLESKEYDHLKLSDKKIDINLDYYPQLGFGVGVSTSLTTDEVNSIFLSVENKYRSQGYSISHNEFYLDNPLYLWFSLKVRIIENLTVSLDAGSTSADAQPQLYSVKAYGVYNFNVFKLNWLKPYAGLGINHILVSLNKSFNYGDRISPIDTSGRYDYLSTIRIYGEGKSLGFNITGGLELTASTIGFNLCADYSFMNPITVQSNESTEGYKLNFSGFTFGMTLTIYF